MRTVTLPATTNQNISLNKITTSFCLLRIKSISITRCIYSNTENSTRVHQYFTTFNQITKPQTPNGPSVNISQHSHEFTRLNKKSTRSTN